MNRGRGLLAAAVGAALLLAGCEKVDFRRQKLTCVEGASGSTEVFVLNPLTRKAIWTTLDGSRTGTVEISDQSYTMRFKGGRPGDCTVTVDRFVGSAESKCITIGASERQETSTYECRVA